MTKKIFFFRGIMSIWATIQSEFYWTFFVYNGKNYDRFSEEFNEKAYSVNELKSVLNNFNIIGIYDELNLDDIKDDSERIYFVLKKGDN
ncbi:MAG: hypothetical protein ACLS26_07420 [Eubacterium sp.]